MADKVERLRKQHQAALEKAKTAEKKLKAAQKMQDNKRKTEERKKDTRRKILLGSFLQTQFAKNTALKAQLEASFFASLVRDGDRQLFGLPPLAETVQPVPVETVKVQEAEPA